MTRGRALALLVGLLVSSLPVHAEGGLRAPSRSTTPSLTAQAPAAEDDRPTAVDAIEPEAADLRTRARSEPTTTPVHPP